MFFLVDSNILIDILTMDPNWFRWASSALARLGVTMRPALNQVILAEVAPRFATVQELDAAFPIERIARLDLPWEAAHRAGHAYTEYRRAGGTRRSPLPDFYIGAHAEVSGLTLVTRDGARYRTYFPSVTLVAP